MKKSFLSLLFLGLSIGVFAQVGIGTTNPDAALDVVSTTDGILVPRFATASLPASGTTGELLFDSTAVTFKYWNGSAWVPFGGGSADGNGIYSGSGSLSAPTTVTLGSNALTFSGNAGVRVDAPFHLSKIRTTSDLAITVDATDCVINCTAGSNVTVTFPTTGVVPGQIVVLLASNQANTVGITTINVKGANKLTSADTASMYMFDGIEWMNITGF